MIYQVSGEFVILEVVHRPDVKNILNFLYPKAVQFGVLNIGKAITTLKLAPDSGTGSINYITHSIVAI